MGDRYADIAARCFGDLAGSGAPLTAREAAAVLHSVIHIVQADLDFPTGERTLEEFAAYLQSAPLDELREADCPRQLEAVDSGQTAAFIARNTIEPPVEVAPPETPPDSPAVTGVRAAIEELQGFRDALGGAPHYATGERPGHVREHRTFFGIPQEACRAWSEKTIAHHWVPQFLWKAIGRAFGVSDTPPTRYEDVSLQLDSLRLLAEHRDHLADRFRQDPAAARAEFGALTRLMAHMDQNGGPEGMIRAIDAYLELFLGLYEDARAKGQLELGVFFQEALTGVCMENRFSNMQEYAMLHPVGDAAEAEASASVYDPEHDPNDDVVTALFKEVGVLAHERGGTEELGWEDIRRHLLDTMVGKERAGEDGQRVVITPEMIEESRASLNDALMFEV
jgi:hypothetical protein